VGGINVQDIPMPRGAELGCGMDFNVDPMAFVMFWRAGPHIHFFQEFELPNADTEYACSILREKYVENDVSKRDPNVHRDSSLYTVYPDPAGDYRHTSSPRAKTDFYYLQQAGFDIKSRSAHPLVRDRENAVNGKFKPMVGTTTMTVSPTGCKKLVKYLATYSHQLKNKQKAMSHLIDAMGYPLELPTPMSPRRFLPPNAPTLTPWSSPRY
jgi:hypothetical protein